MIRTGKYPVFEGLVCGKGKCDASSISGTFLTSEFSVFFANRSRRIGAARNEVSRQVYQKSYLQVYKAYNRDSRGKFSVF